MIPSRPPPRRVRVVGNSGSGKTTAARVVAERLGVPLLEVDAIVHLTGWRTASQAEFETAMRDFLTSPEARDGWVVDGNYATRLTAVTDAADTVLWLDHSRAVVMTRLVGRTLARALTRRELWNGNRERLRTLLSVDPMTNLWLWAWTQHSTTRARYAALAEEDPQQRWVRLRTPAEMRRWLRPL
ncbi:AAA family ATPase [Actinotalea sp. K2]|uniref:AAA family ATPase n=1 Tax=Actinotalea sp. K2 TaxID=2939438 RepID=UPI002018169F|nr:AAA family ATPase [Actinotalea sp. K2]MCL3860327.1 AAA family ATPase [Actinotalea sp. K2]